MPINPDRVRCQGKSRRTGEPCKAWAIRGRNYCRAHGGTKPNGITHYNYQGKGRSLAIPARLMDDYLASRDDPEILSLRADIALQDARLNDVLKRVTTGESGELWKQLKATIVAMKEAQDRKDSKASGAHLGDALRLIDRGIEDYSAWVEVRQIADIRRKLVESERRRDVELHLMISANEVAMLTRAVIQAVRAHVRDDNTLKAVVSELERFALA